MKDSKILKLLILLMAFGLISCSSNDSSSDLDSGSTYEVVELGDEEDVIEIVSSDVEEVGEYIDDGEVRSDSIMDRPVASVAAQNEEVSEKIDEVMADSPASYEEYIVQKGDTLMILAFRMYRDVFKWRDIASWNEEVLKGKTRIRPGDRLKIKVLDLNGVVWQPRGNPYLIDRRDTLTGISEKVYHGYSRYWRDIWNNNKVLIKSPDVIYAGFTLYYLPYEEVSGKTRELASKKK